MAVHFPLDPNAMTDLFRRFVAVLLASLAIATRFTGSDQFCTYNGRFGGTRDTAN